MTKIFSLICAGLLSLALASAQAPSSQNSLDLDGVNDYVQTSFPGITGTAPRSVEAWIKLSVTTDPNAGGVQQIITDWGVFATGSRFTFNVLWNNAIRLEVSGSGLSGTIAVNDGQWHHVVGVYDPNATNQLALYVDGVLDNTGNIPTPINTASGNMRIGQRVDGARHFDGSIDEVRIWNIPLSQAQVQANFTQSLCSLAGVLAYYQFDEGVAGGNNMGVNTLPDLSGNNYNGTLQNFALNGQSSNWVQGVILTPGVGTSATINATSCGPYTSPSGTYVFTSSGTYADTILNAAGCDSLLTINLNIGEASFDTIAVDACGFYTSPGGQFLTASGNYQDTIVNAAGCDSILSINLTINSGSSNAIAVTSCGNYVSPSGNQTWTVSGVYQDTVLNSVGCDSVITIDLTIGMNSTESLFETACDSFVSPSGLYTWTSTGSYLDTIPNAAGCDSILVIGLQINQSSSSAMTVVSCGPYTSPSGNYVWSNSGTYRDTILNQDGCFEYLTLNVDVVEIDTSVVRINRDLIAQASGVSYQWLDCNSNFAPILAANQQTYTPDDPGTYAVEISDNGCVDTSACFTISSGLSLPDDFSSANMQVYPNPSAGQFVLDLGMVYEQVEYRLYSLRAKLVLEKRSAKRQYIPLDLSKQPEGVYILEVEIEGRRYSSRISKL